MWLFLVILGIGGVWFWQSNKRRAYRFVRSVQYLSELENGATVDEANGRAAKLFTKHSSDKVNDNALVYALERAAALTGGKQLPWINEARQKGFAIDAGNRLSEVGVLHPTQSRDLGQKVGASVRHEITMPFTSSFIDIPDDLFLDPYVAGYTNHLVKIFGVAGGILQLPEEQLGDFFEAATTAIIQTKNIRAFSDFSDDDAGYLQGGKHAAIYGVALLNPDKLDKGDPLIQDAQKMLETRAGFVGEVEELLGGVSNPNMPAEQAALIWAIKSLTLGNYLNKRYGIEF